MINGDGVKILIIFVLGLSLCLYLLNKGQYVQKFVETKVKLFFSNKVLLHSYFSGFCF
jgi:hypothetical protein